MQQKALDLDCVRVSIYSHKRRWLLDAVRFVSVCKRDFGRARYPNLDENAFQLPKRSSDGPRLPWLTSMLRPQNF